MAKIKWQPEQARRAGEQMLELVVADKAALEPRLPASVIPGLQADVAELSDKSSGAVSAAARKKAATRTQTENAAELMTRVMAVRKALKLAGVGAPTLKAAGVGKPMSVKTVKSVLAGARMIGDAHAAFGDGMRGAGVLPEDIETINMLAQTLKAADTTQEGQKVVAKTSTAARKAAQERVEKAVLTIAGVANLVFVGNPNRLALYEAVIPASPKPPKKQPPA